MLYQVLSRHTGKQVATLLTLAQASRMCRDANGSMWFLPLTTDRR